MGCVFEVGDVFFDSDGNKWEVIDVNSPENDVENHDVPMIHHAVLVQKKKLNVLANKEENHKGSLRTDEEHYRAIMNIIGDKENVKVEIPAYAASLITCFQRHDCDVLIRTGRNT